MFAFELWKVFAGLAALSAFWLAFCAQKVSRLKDEADSCDFHMQRLQKLGEFKHDDRLESYMKYEETMIKNLSEIDDINDFEKILATAILFFSLISIYLS